MKPSIQTLGQILYSPSQYVIPVFQRNYRWRQPQWEQLWESIEVIQSPDKKGNHFMGFLVFVPGLPQPGQNTTFHLIDGQQRLTTLSILLIALRNTAKEQGLDELAEEISQDYLIHRRKDGDGHYRLLPKQRDREEYLSLVDGGDETVDGMADAAEYFADKAANFASDNPDKLRDLFNVVCQRLEFMCATLETENAYSIFKSLNSTGVPLGASDLIRNFVFMHVNPTEHDKFDDASWTPLESRFENAEGGLDEDRFSRFFRDFLMSSAGRYIGPKDTFPAFESRYAATGFSPLALTETLAQNAEYHEIIASKHEDMDSAVTHALLGLNALESSTTYPLILALFNARAAGVIQSDQLAAAIQMLRGFILRRFICSESSRGYGQLFVRAIVQLGDNPLQALEYYLQDRGWPEDERFQSTFAEFPMYGSVYAREVLEALERAPGHKEPADLSQTQIEHILPQTLSDGWRENLGTEADRIQATWQHRIGNLTLSAYNLPLWNHTFDIKRAVYAESNIGLTRTLATYSTWGELEISQRGQLLASRAVAIWRGPQAIAHPPKPPITDQRQRGELRHNFWSGLADYLAVEHSELWGRLGFDIRPSRSIRVSSSIKHVGLVLRCAISHNTIGIEVWFWRKAALPLFQSALASADELNELMGDPWAFEQFDTKGQASISLEKSVDNLSDPTTWGSLYPWFADRLAGYFAAIVPRLKAAEKALVSADASDGDDAGQLVTDRTFWENRSSTSLLGLVDQSVAIIKEFAPAIELNYKHRYVGLTINSQSSNFVLFYPSRNYVRISVRIDKDQDVWKAKFTEVGVPVVDIANKRRVYLQPSAEQLMEYRSLMREFFRAAYKETRA